MATDDIYSAAFQISLHSVVGTFTIHLKETSNNSDNDRCKTLAGELGNNLGPLIQGCLSPSAALQSVYVRKVSGSPLIPGLSEQVDRAGTFALGGNAIPANCCGVMSIQSDDQMVKRGGRIYISGISKLAVSGGNLSGAFFGNEWETLRTALGGVLGGPAVQTKIGIWVRERNGLPVTPPEFYDATRIVARQILFTQGRRKGRRLGVTT